jgi:hypothetical protein
MKQKKSKSRSKITDVMRSDISEKEQNANSVPEQMQTEVNEVSLSCFRCNVEFCVGYGRDN